MTPSKQTLASLVASGRADSAHMADLGADLVGEIKRNPDIVQVRGRGSDIITKKESKRQISYLVSDETPDRMGDVIRVKGWDLSQYKKNPVILWAHDGASVPPIGRSENVRRRYSPTARLTADVEFAPREAYEFADTIYQLANRGFIKATSVGFLPKETEEVDEKMRQKLGMGRYGQLYTKAELMEISVVAVPANPAALELGMKQLMSEGILEKSMATRFIQEYPKDEAAAIKRAKAICRSFVDFGAISRQEEPKEEKSPACRMDDETTQECVERKIPELIDEGMDQDQAVAVANSVCETSCSDKSNEESTEERSMKDNEVVEKDTAEAAHNGEDPVELAIPEAVDANQEEAGRYKDPEISHEAKFVNGMAWLIEQQAEQTKATRQLVDALTDLTKSIHRDLPDGVQGDGSVSEPEVATPDVEEKEVIDVEGLLEGRLRGFAEGLRRDLNLSNNTENNR